MLPNEDIKLKGRPKYDGVVRQPFIKITKYRDKFFIYIDVDYKLNETEKNQLYHFVKYLDENYTIGFGIKKIIIKTEEIIIPKNTRRYVTNKE